MALGDSYATLAELKSYMGITDSGSDTLLTAALASASRAIEHYCRRQFNKTTTASARVFCPETPVVAWIDDVHTTTDLVIKTDDGDDGTYETTWDSDEYQLEPVNGVVDGESGWPYYRIKAVSGRRLYPARLRPHLQVTAQWGWTAVPAGIKQACLIKAEEIHKLKDAPFGVAGFSDLGAIRVRENSFAASLLTPYRLGTAEVL